MLENIAGLSLAKEWIPKLYKEFSTIRSSRVDELDKISDVFGDPKELAKYYIEPDCQQFNPADNDEEENIYIVREPVFRRLESFLSGEQRRGLHQLLVLSDAGMGKTSLLVMLKLAHMSSFFKKPYNCVLLKIGVDTVGEIERIEKKSNTLLLLDGLDEDPHAWGQIKWRIKSLLKSTENFWRVIITCRTQFFSGEDDPFNRRGQVEVEGFICPVIYNSMFSTQQVEEYLNNKLKNSKNSTELKKKAESIIAGMGSLKMRPMLLSHVEDFLDSDRDSWDEYSIYEVLIRSWLLREQRKLFHNIERYPAIEELLQCCIRLATYLQENGKREVSEDELNSAIISIPSLEYIPFMNIGGRSLLNKNSDGEYRFSHYSIQEYLVVSGCVTDTTNYDFKNIRLTDQMNKFFNAWLKSNKFHDSLGELLTYYSVFNNSDLSSTDLPTIEFIKRDLRGVNFTDSNLVGASFVECDLTGANFHRANLNSVTFMHSVLENTNFVGAIMKNVNIIDKENHVTNITFMQRIESNFIVGTSV